MPKPTPTSSGANVSGARRAAADAGRAAEARALAWLGRRGLRLVARNFRTRFGEIDLVMRDGNCVVFVEVRYRRAGSRLGAADSVGPRKQRRLMAAASLFLARERSLAECPARFDVVAIDGPAGGESGLQWIRDAFRPGTA